MSILAPGPRALRCSGVAPFARGAAGSALVLAAFACGLSAQTPGGVPGIIEARIARIERGLLRPVEVRGRPPVRYGLEARMRHYRVPAVSVAVVQGGTIEWARAWGLADAGTGRPADTATLFQAASISKPVAALAALRLVDRGRVDLDADIGRYVKDWVPPRAAGVGDAPVTLRRLLSHTAGLTVHGFLGYEAGEEVPDVLEVLEGTGPANSPPVAVDLPPGTRWRYSGGGYTAVQLLVEEVTGRPFVLVMRRVLDAIGMTGSTWEQPLPDSLVGRAAVGYRKDGSPVAGRWHTYPEMAAAGLWTTPSDLARYAIAVGRWLAGETGGVLTPARTREMLEPGLEGWGLGPSTAGSGLDFRFQHGGANEGYRSRFVYYPRRGLGAFVMTNGDAGDALVEEILLSVAAEYAWPDPSPRRIRALPLDAREARDYAGRYRIAGVPDVPVLVQWRGGRLTLRAGAREPSEIVRVARDRFVVLSDGEPLAFERDAAGRVVAMTAYGTRATRLAAP